MSGGFLPTQFTMEDPRDLLGLFAVYGLGFAALTCMLLLLNVRALRVGVDLRLNEVERLRTRQAVISNAVLGGTGLVSAIFALVMPPRIGVWAGFWYMTLPVTMPLLAVRFGRRVVAVQEKHPSKQGTAGEP